MPPTVGNPTAANRPPLVDADPHLHGFKPWSMDPNRCRVMVRVGSGYTHCHQSRDRHLWAVSPWVA